MARHRIRIEIEVDCSDEKLAELTAELENPPINGFHEDAIHERITVDGAVISDRDCHAQDPANS